MNQNLLIVDDEVEILSWLEEMFRYDFPEEIGVYTANSAIEALELLDRIKFDAVLTDIRMPGMDGITLFRRIKENWPRCKTVFLTGYRSFDDMYEVFRHRDVRYLLKSEDDDVIMETVREVLAEIRTELEQEKLKEERDLMIQRADRQRRQECINQILSGKTDTRNAEKNLNKAGIDLDVHEKLLLFLIRIDESASRNASGANAEVLEEILKDNMPPRAKTYIHIWDVKWLYLLVQKKDREDKDYEGLMTVVQGGLEYAQEIFKNQYGQTFSAVIQKTPGDFKELPRRAVRMRRLMAGYLGGEKEVILQEELAGAEQQTDSLPELMAKIPRMKQYLELRKRREFFEILSDAADFTEKKSRHDVYALEIYYSISIMLLQFINENRLNEQIAFKAALFKLTKVDEHENWTEAFRYLFTVSDAVFSLLGENQNTLAERAMTRILDYIDTHLSEDIPLTTLAKVGGFNESYLSRLFKQLCRTTVTEYILGKRMKLAQSLLTESDDKIQDIAARSGYPSPHSFARAFRNYAGVSPAEYRELHRKE